MPKALSVALLVGALTLGLPGISSADWQFTPFIGRTFKTDTSIIDLDTAVGSSHWNFGGMVTLLGAGPIGAEGLLVYTPGFFQQDNPPDRPSDLPPRPLVVNSRALAFMGNVVLATPQKRSAGGLRPFVSGGIGLLHASMTDLLDVFPVRTNLLGYNIGGGAIGFLSDSTGLRFDLRYYRNLKPSDESGEAFERIRLSYWTAGVGFVFRY